MKRAARSELVLALHPFSRGIAFTLFSSRDVVRHPLVQRIVQAYEASAPDDAR